MIAKLVAVVVAVSFGGAAMAQGFSGGPASQPFNDSGIRTAPSKGAPPQARAKPVLAPIPLVTDPWQRLDRGAVLCDSEAALAQHQAAVQARVDGRGSGEPTGCRMVQEMMAVSVLARHGPARTEVSLPATADQRTGWTDAAIPKDRPVAR